MCLKCWSERIETYDSSASCRNSLRCAHSLSSIFSLLSHVARGRLRRCADFQRSLDRLSRLRAFQTDILTWAVMQSFSPKSATERPPCPKCGASMLAVHTRPHNADYPLVCLDETSKQLVAETRTPIPMKRGRTARIDYEYERNGTANLFMLFAPLEGWRHVEVTDRHTAVDYAHVLKDLADRHFPHAKTIVLVQDNLNIHSKA